MPPPRSAPDPARTFLTVTLPLALPGIIAGMVLCFAKALGEFGATITFVSNIPGETQTISAAIYTFMQIPGGEGAAGRLVVVAIIIALAALVASEWLARRAGTALPRRVRCCPWTWKKSWAIFHSPCVSKQRATSPLCSDPPAQARPRWST